MYTVLSAIFTAHVREFPMWMMPAIGSAAGVWAGARAWGWLSSQILANTLAVAWTVSLAAALMAVKGMIALAFLAGLMGAFAVALAAEELNKTFCRFHTFCILLGTSIAGLALGWGMHSVPLISQFLTSAA
jgi:hypothetical protein